jgi:hypothetical protein
MTCLQDPSRGLWLWLFNEGGRYTAQEIAVQQDWSVEYAIDRLFSMSSRGQIQKFPPAEGSRRQRYGVTGTCRVPSGMTVAEVQA